MEHLQKGALCKHNRYPTADIMVIMKTETGNSPDRFLLLPLYPFLPLFPSLHLSGVQVVSHAGPSVSWLLSAQHLFHLLALCQGQLPIKHPYRQIYCCLPSIWSKSTAVKRICKPANIAAWMRNRMGQGKINIQHHQNHYPSQKKMVDRLVGGQLRPHAKKVGWIAVVCLKQSCKKYKNIILK